MKVRFWGTRGSLPSPLRPEEVEEKIVQAILDMPEIDAGDAGAVRAYVRGLPPLQRGTAGGNTPCVEVQAGGEIFAVDAGSGIRELGLALMDGPFGRGEGTLHLFISHLHWDHIQGFPMFQPAFVPGNRLLIYGLHDLATAFEEQQRPPYWPVSLSYMRADIQFIPMQVGQPLSVGKVRVTALPSSHPNEAFMYRFEDQHSVLVHASDAEYKQLDETSLQPYVEFFRNADALIFDAQYTLREAWQKEDWGHSSAMIGVDLARSAGVKKLILFHHDPTYSDADLQEIKSRVMTYQIQDRTRPICEVIVACEGITLDLTPVGAVDLQLTPDGEAAILSPVHTFDQYGVDQLARQLACLDDQAHSSIIDLSQVDTLTTAGLKSLVTLHQKQSDATIVLAAPSGSIRQVIELSGYLDHFAIYPSVEAALSAVQAREALNLPGQLVKGRYQIEEKIGQGRLGTVLRATDVQENRPVALKILSPSFSQSSLDRLAQQADKIMTLDHPHIVKVFDWYREGIKVEGLVTGPSLHELFVASELEEGDVPFSTDRALEIALDMMRALEYAHSRGVIHTDLKPENVFLTPDGAKLSGFGLGRLEHGRNLLDLPLLLLSAAYLAPEQILGQALDARTDLYALGVILYQLLTGRLPFVGSDREVLQAHLQQAPSPPRQWNPRISPSLEHLVLKLLAKNPNERYASAQQARHVSISLSFRPEDLPAQEQGLLVGRRRQLGALGEAWGEAQEGRGQLAFISGESGIGKTTLARQFAAQSKAPVQLVADGQERAGRPAYHVFSQVLRSYFTTVPPEFFDETARQLCANLVRLVPEIRQMLPCLPESIPLEPEQEQLRLMSSLTQFIRRATRERAWLIIFDDLQWADPSSLELLRYLCRHLPSMALMIIGIYRDVELNPQEPLLATLRDLSRHPGYRHFPLGRLDMEAVGQMLAHIWQPPVPDPMIEKIYQHTGGNPFYVEAVAKGLQDEGLVLLEEGRWRFPSPDSVHLPPSVREAIWHRIGLLSPDIQALLSQAAVLGQTFQFDTLREMSGLSEWQVLEYLDAALERQLVQEDPGDTVLRFRHVEIQHVLYADLGPLRRRMLHRQAAEALERQAMPEPEQIAEELAYHYYEAGEYERALAYSLPAARQAQATYANEAALMWYNRTLEMLNLLDPQQVGAFQLTRLLAHQHLGEVLTLIGRYDEALEHCAAARAQLEAARLSSDQARQLAALCHQTAQVCERRGEYDLALTWLEKGLGYLDEDEPILELARIYNLSGWVRWHQGYFEVAKTWLERALSMAREAQFQQVEADSLRRLGAVAYYSGDYRTYRAHSEQALQIYRQIGDRRGEGAVLNNLAIFYAGQGDYAKALTFQEQARLIWQEMGDRRAESVSLNNLGGFALFLGDYAGASDYYEQSLRVCREIGDRRGEGRALDSLGVVSAARGDYRTTLSFYQGALRIRQEIGDLRGEAETTNHLGTLARDFGDYGAARASYNQSLLIYREVGDRLGEFLVLSDLGLLLHQLGEDSDAGDYCQHALELAQEVGDPHLLGYAWTHLGHVQEGLGQLTEAAESYRKALALRRKMGEDHLAMEPLAGLARLALLQADIPRAQSHVDEILAYLELGTLEGTEEPFRVYLACYRVLRASGDSRAAEFLRMVHQQMQQRITQIEDEASRRSFQENVAVHRQLLALWDDDLPGAEGQG